jgi:endonuclease/exonuclease/phosphatase family metal-dependent hydrolase
MILRIATYNLQEGGGAGDEPVLPSRWNQQIVMLREWDLDILLVQEMHGWDRDGYMPLFAAEEELGMRGLFAPAPMVNCHLGMFMRAAKVWPKQWDQRYTSMAWHAYGQATLRVAGAGDLTVISVHLSPWAPEQRLDEAAIIGQALGKSKYGIAAGDYNCVPPGDPEPPWDKMPRRKQAQAIPTGDGVRADRRVGERLARAGLRDAARDYAESVGAGSPDITGDWYRCDQIWVSPTFRVQRLETVDTGLSDHKLIFAELELPGPDLERETGA